MTERSLRLAAWLAIQLVVSQLSAQELVVDGMIESTSGGFMFPDGSVQATAAEGIANLLTVAPSGAQFSTVGDALAAIGSTLPAATESNPYLIRVGPGVYPEAVDLEMTPFVDIEGSGRKETEIEGRVLMAANAELRELTVSYDGTDGAVDSSDGGSLRRVAVEVETDTSVTTHGIGATLPDQQIDLVIDDVDVTVENLGGNAEGIEPGGGVVGSSVVIRNTRVSAAGVSAPGLSAGVRVASEGAVLEDLTITGGGSPDIFAGLHTSAAMTGRSLKISAMGASTNAAILIIAGLADLSGVSAEATGGTLARGALVSANPDAELILRDSVLEATGASSFNRAVEVVPDGTASIAHSQLIGDLVGAGTFHCLGNYDETLAAVSCPAP